MNMYKNRIKKKEIKHLNRTKTKRNKSKKRRNKTKTKLQKGSGFKTLKIGKKYFNNCSSPVCGSNECFAGTSDLKTIFPPFNGDNEIYIWLNDRCFKDPESLFIPVGIESQVKIKRTVLRSIWGHCAFSFSPNEGPIWGYGPNLLPILDKYVIKSNGNIIDADGYITFQSYDTFKEFRNYFESISYTGSGLTLQGSIGIDTESFKDISNLPNCNVYRFILFTNKNTSGNLDNVGLQLGLQNSIYGIYKQNDICYGEYDTKLIYNCITFIINYFKPYYYEKQFIASKCIFKKVNMDVLGKYCASIGIMNETLKQTILFDTYDANTPLSDKPACLGGDLHDTNS
jgi:hypothetical protein